MATTYEFNGSKASVKLLDTDGNPADLKGCVKSITPPEVTKEMDTDPRIGEYGQVSRPLGLSAMECSMELSGINLAFVKACQDAFHDDTEISIQVTMPGKDRYTGADANQILTMRGYVQRLPSASEISPQAYNTYELALAVNYFNDSFTSTESSSITLDARETN